jgi:NADH-quinone oxidoreductase subunit L
MYQFVTHKIIFNCIGRTAAWFDKNIVDGIVNLIGNGVRQLSETIKTVQSGKVQAYAMYFLAGVLALAVLFLYWWK